MRIQLDKINIFYTFYRRQFNREWPTIFLLHGFTGSSKDWSPIVFGLKKLKMNFVGIDLPGFGKSSKPREIYYYKTSYLVNILDKLRNHLNLKHISILGYSMGGRLAISFAVKYPKVIDKLILESTSLGLQDKEARKLRVQSDRKLSDLIKNDVKEFYKYWYNLELFNNPKNEFNFDSFYSNKLSKSKIALVNSLIGFGTGVMPYCKKIFKCSFKLFLITGSIDRKFTKLNQEIDAKYINSRHFIIKNSAHTIHNDNTEEFISIIKKIMIT